MSLITESSAEMVQRFARVRTMREAVGASPHAGDLLKWDAREVDGFVMLQQEQSKVERLMKVSDLPPRKPR